MSRRPVAFVPCEEVWQILSELCPSKFSEAAKHPGECVFVSEIAAYGLLDAPLLWHLRAVEVLRDISCTFILRDASTHDLLAILTLHVDDLLLAANMKQIESLQASLSKAFGTLTLDLGIKGFKHFGVDIWQSPSLTHVTASQEKYLADLKPIELPTRCLKTADCSPEKVTEFRALVSAIAWTGVTSPYGLASASILQGALPLPKWSDIVKLNQNLVELKETYCPCLLYTSPSPRDS